MGQGRDARQRILDAAAGTLSRRPRATLDEIAREAGVSRATLHRAFESRDALLRGVALEALRLAEQALAESVRPQGEPMQNLFDLTTRWVPLGERFRLLLDAQWVEHDPELRDRLQRVEAELQNVIEGARRSAKLRSDVPIEWQTRLYVEMLYLGWGCITDQIFVPRDAVRVVFDSFVSGQRCGAADA
jgi:TetR/AcrR family transcriptional repressor of mexCD-oprJ operon